MTKYVIKSRFKDSKTSIIQQIYIVKFEIEKLYSKSLKLRYCTENINGAKLFNENELEMARKICEELSDNFNIYPVCPICRFDYEEHPVISRKDNKTQICPKCSFNEAIAAFYKNKTT